VPEGHVRRILHHADDLEGLLRARRRRLSCEPRADNGTPGQQLCGERLADDGDGRGLRRVALVEIAPADERNPERREVAGARGVEPRVELARSIPFGPHVVADSIAAERYDPDGRGRLYAGQPAQAFHKPATERRALIRGYIEPAEREAGDHDASRVEAGI